MKFNSKLILIIAFITSILFSNMLMQAAPLDDGVLRWAADAEGNVPYIFPDPKKPSNIIGFEVDLANALAKELGVKPEFVQNQWDGLIPG